MRNPFRLEDEEPPTLPPPSKLTGSGFDRERFIYKLLGAVIMSQLVLFSSTTLVCGMDSVRRESDITQVCGEALTQLNSAFSASVKLLVALLAGQGMVDRNRQ
jgi:hypothetical protein